MITNKMGKEVRPAQSSNIGSSVKRMALYSRTTSAKMEKTLLHVEIERLVGEIVWTWWHVTALPSFGS